MSSGTLGADDQQYLRELPARYQAISKIAQLGAEGRYQVYRARRDGQQEVALQISAPGGRSEEGSERILRRLSHPGIPALLDAFKTHSAEVLVTELVEGETLAERLASSADRHDPRGSLELLSETAEILRYLHALHPPIVHRDLKPANLMLTRERRIKLIDFNAATDDPGRRPVGGRPLIGTVGYVPFEQYEGRASPASDVYALGATFAHLLTGVPPQELPRRGMIPDLQPLIPSKPLASLLADCMALDPEQRPTAETVIARIQRMREPQAQDSLRHGKLDELWESARNNLGDLEKNRAFMRLAVISEAHPLAIERYNAIAAAEPGSAELVARYKRELALQVAATLLAKTASQEAAREKAGSATAMTVVKSSALGGAAAVAAAVWMQSAWGIALSASGFLAAVFYWALLEQRARARARS